MLGQCKEKSECWYFLGCLKLQPSVHKSSKHFGYSFAFDYPTLWNALPNDIWAALFVAKFRRRLKTYLYNKVRDPCYAPGHEYRIMFCLLRLRIFSQVEIKCYRVELELEISHRVWQIGGKAMLICFIHMVVCLQSKMQQWGIYITSSLKIHHLYQKSLYYQM